MLWNCSDLVTGLIALMNGDYNLPVNLGNPEEHTIKEFAEIVQKEIGNLGVVKLSWSAWIVSAVQQRIIPKKIK